MELQAVYKSNEEITNPGLIKTTILAGNGIFEKQKSWIGESVKQVSDYKFAGLPEMEETISVTSEDLPKIPAEAIRYVIKWYRDTTKSTGKEAQINFYNAKGKRTLNVNGVEKNLEDIKGVHFWTDELFSYTPKQDNSGALTAVDNDDVYDALNKYIGMYVETHSHNSMQAFASGTDLANSKVDGLQLVFGQFNTSTVQMHTWITVRGVTSQYVIPEIVEHFVEMPNYVLGNDNKYYYDIDEMLDMEFDEKLINIWYGQVAKPKWTAPKYPTYTPRYTAFGTPDRIRSNSLSSDERKWYEDEYPSSPTLWDLTDDTEDVEEVVEDDDTIEVETMDSFIGTYKPFNSPKMNKKFKMLIDFIDSYFTFDGNIGKRRLVDEIKSLIFKIGKRH